MTENRGEKTDGGYRRTDETDSLDSTLVPEEAERYSTVGDSRPCYEPDSVIN